MDKRTRALAEVALTLAMAWWTLPAEDRRQARAAILLGSARVFRATAGILGHAAIEAERRYFEVIRP